MVEPRIMVIGSPAWVETVADLGYTLVRHEDRASYIQTLIREAVALVIVDSRIPDWTYWIVALKIEQATRRIPVLVVAHDEARCAEAAAAGADFCLLVEKISTELSQTIDEYTRLRDPDLVAELLCQCDEELPPRAQVGIEKFNAGEYYAQHDLFEALWMDETGPVRDLYRAILQVGIAYYHIVRGNPRGALKMLLRCEQWFAILPDVCQGVDIRQLHEDANRVRTALETMETGDIAAFDRTLLRPIILSDMSG